MQHRCLWLQRPDSEASDLLLFPELLKATSGKVGKTEESLSMAFGSAFYLLFLTYTGLGGFIISTSLVIAEMPGKIY